MWMLLVLYYGMAKGAREVSKKLAMTKSSILEVLIFYSCVSFVMVLPSAKEAFAIDRRYLPMIVLKSFVIFITWMMSSNSLKKLPISLYGIVDLSRMLFATILGVVVLKETLTRNQIIGFILVCAGLLALKGRKEEGTKEYNQKVFIYALIAFFSCFFNAISGTLDKILMKNITSGQLQFWYLFFLLSFYLIYALIKREKLSVSTLKNPYVWMMAILFVTADRALFIAHSYPSSKLTLMTLIQQCGVIVTIICGKYIFHEKGILYKLFCAAIVILGIVVAVIK